MSYSASLTDLNRARSIQNYDELHTSYNDGVLLSALFKQYIRELATPVVPYDRYSACVKLGMTYSPSSLPVHAMRDLLDTFPSHNRDLLKFLVSVMKYLCDENVTSTY